MAQNAERLHVISIKEGIPLMEGLKRVDRIVNGRVNAFQVVLDGPTFLRPEGFSLLLQHALHLQKPPDPQAIPFDDSKLRETDREFAQMFDYQVKQVGYGRMISEGLLEAWVAPVLIYMKHPLAYSNGGHLYLETDTSQPHIEKPRIGNILPEGQIVAAHYMSFSVENRPSVLAHLLFAIAEQEINICELRQPEVSEGAASAQIALLLDPCKTEQIHAATKAIGRLSDCLNINAVYKVLGNPTRDISNKSNKAI